MLDNEASERHALLLIRTLHTFVWAVFASSILAIPVFTLERRIHIAFWLSLLVWGEIVILAVNRLRCPLTGVAARYTKDRRDNFDIFLPLWLAKHNKLVFGSLFAISQLLLLWRWTL
jgi:hypothetical protein